MVNKLNPDSIGKDIEKTCQSIYSFHDVFVKKVKMLKKYKLELVNSQSSTVKGVVVGKQLVMRQGLKLNELMVMNHQSKNLFKSMLLIVTNKSPGCKK